MRKKGFEKDYILYQKFIVLMHLSLKCVFYQNPCKSTLNSVPIFSPAIHTVRATGPQQGCSLDVNLWHSYILHNFLSLMIKHFRQSYFR